MKQVTKILPVLWKTLQCWFATNVTGSEPPKSYVRGIFQHRGLCRSRGIHPPGERL